MLASDNQLLPKASPKPGRLRLHAQLARDLGIAIVTGQYAPGEVLAGEIAFAENNSVSRTPYREAIRMLAAKGLVESRPKAGTRVNDPSRWHMLDPDVLEWTYAGEPSQSAVRDLFELRRIIEPAAAELAAQRRTAGQLAQMGHALEEIVRHGFASLPGQCAEQAFHAALLSASGNAGLASLASTIKAAVRWTTIYRQRSREVSRDALPEYQRLFEAIVERDGSAARSVLEQLIELGLAEISHV